MREGTLKVAFQALQTGKRLKHATGWKWAGLLCLVVAFVVPNAVEFCAGFAWYPHWLPAHLDALYLLGLVSGYVDLATTEKIGLPPRGVAVPLAVPDGVQFDEMPADPERMAGGGTGPGDRAGKRDALADAFGNFHVD